MINQKAFVNRCLFVLYILQKGDKKVATKLRNLKIKKVDFVDEGANPDADIKMRKKKDREEPKNSSNILKKLFGFIGKAAGMNQEEIDNAVAEIQKGDSISFNEKINEVNNQKICDEMWDICYALQSSLCSILNDDELDSASAAAAMQESLDEFYAVMQESIKKWSSGGSANIVKKNEDVSEAELEIMKSAVERLNETIEKAAKEESEKEQPDNNQKPKGEEKKMGMKIDKSKLTDAERAFLENIEKRYGVDEGDNPTNGGTAPTSIQQTLPPTPTEPTVVKSAIQPVPDVVASVAQTDEPDSIYKGLHPAVRAELESLKKFREDAEARELTEVAKRYVIIGKKEEELVPMLKSLKAAGGTAYNDMIAVLDQAVAAVEKSGVFSEIGKSGHGSTAGAAEAKIETIAKGYMEKDSSLDYTAAVAKAWEDNPELMSEYETEAGF